MNIRSIAVGESSRANLANPSNGCVSATILCITVEGILSAALGFKTTVESGTLNTFSIDALVIWEFALALSRSALAFAIDASVT